LHTARLLSPPSPQRFGDLDEDSLDGAMELTLSAPPPGDDNPSDVSFLSKIDRWSWAAFMAPSDNMLHKSSGFSSLDYDTIYNDGEEHYLHLTPHTSHLTPHTSHLGEEHYLDKRKLGRSVWGFTGTTFIRWFIFVFIGIITGALGRFMELSIEYLHSLRSSAFDRCAAA
jgi:hypothetical protein